MSGSGKKFKSNGDPSICEWSLQAEFKTREQAHGFIRDYLASDSNLISFNYDEELVHKGTKYIIHVSGTWAANLSCVAELLERWDYDIDGEAPKA